MNTCLTFSLLVVGILLLPSHAYAYIDPGTGSLILQAVAAAGITAMAFVRGIREKIIGLFRGRKEKTKEE